MQSAALFSVSSPVYEWKGRFRRLPENFELGTTWTLKIAFQMWLCGKPADGIPPLHLVQPVDVAEERNRRKRFSEYQMIMRHCEKILGNSIPKNPTDIDVNNLFDQLVANGLPLGSQTPKGKKRRLDELRWGTFARAVSDIKKKK